MIKKADSIAWPKLIAEAKAGNTDSLSEILKRVYDYLLAVTHGEMNRKLSAKFGVSDVVQKSCLDAHNRIEQFRGTSEIEMRAWLKQILKHNLIDVSARYLATQSRNVDRECSVNWPELMVAHCETPSQVLMRAETNDQLLNAIEELSDRHRFVVEARHRWGWSFANIGAELGISEEAARNLWVRAVKNLQQKLVMNGDAVN